MIKSASKINGEKMAIVCALLSAFFAALTSILAKIGIDGVNSNLATAIRTTFVLDYGMVCCVRRRFSGGNSSFESK